MDCKRRSVTITIIKITIMVIITTTIITIIIVIITTTTIITIIITIVSREQYPQMRGQWPAVGGEVAPMVPLGRPSMHASRGDNMRRMMMVIMMVVIMMVVIMIMI